MLKKDTTLFMFFGLHQRIGDHGQDAHNKVDSLKNWSPQVGFTMRIKQVSSEGKSLYNQTLLEVVFFKTVCHWLSSKLSKPFRLNVYKYVDFPRNFL